jgi:anti-anti-sigma regulatory factor
MGAQLLLSAGKTANADGKKLQFKNIPPAVQNAWKRLGLPASVGNFSVLPP